MPDMNTEELNSILSFELFYLLLTFLRIIVLNFDFLLNLVIFSYSLRRNTLINKFLYFFVHVERLNDFLVVATVVGGFDLINQSINFNGTIVFD